MTKFSNFLEDKIIDKLLRNQAYTPPSAIYLALFTVTPSDSGGGTEVSGNAYARTAIVFSAPTPPGVTSNNADVTFPTASGGNWGTVVAVGVFDAATSGNLLLWGALTVSKTVNDGDTFKVPSGDFDLTVD